MIGGRKKINKKAFRKITVGGFVNQLIKNSGLRDKKNVCPDLFFFIGPYLEPNPFDTLTVFLKGLLKKLNFKKSADDNKSMKNYPANKELNTN